jgi:hydroxypyruvate reductase 1
MNWRIVNPDGKCRIIVTKELPGTRWIEILTDAGCRIEISDSQTILSPDEIKSAIGTSCFGAVAQLSEQWGSELITAFASAGGKIISTYAVGFNNIDIAVASRLGVAVGNTPGVLTNATAEIAVALTFAAARRVAESDLFTRKRLFHGWLPSLYLGELVSRKTLGIVGTGRIGSAYARMMVEGFKMNLVYFSPHPNEGLEKRIAGFGEFLKAQGEEAVTCRKVDSIEELLRESDIVSLHPLLNAKTKHLITRERLALMKKDAILINVSRGAVIDEAALVDHCRMNPAFHAGLDVYEREPELAPGLTELSNIVILPHLGSATFWTREAMAVITARNLKGILKGHPVWNRADMSQYWSAEAPEGTPSIVNAKELGLSVLKDI